MSFLKQDKEQAKGFGTLPAGEYEVFITGVDPNFTSSQKGTPGIEVVLTVRDDIDQNGKKQKLWDTFYITDKAMWRFHQLNDALEVENGFEFETKEDQANFWKGKAVRAYVTIEDYQDKNGQPAKRNLVKSYSKSNFGGEYTPDESEAINISDEDIPF